MVHWAKTTFTLLFMYTHERWRSAGVLKGIFTVAKRILHTSMIIFFNWRWIPFPHACTLNIKLEPGDDWLSFALRLEVEGKS